MELGNNIDIFVIGYIVAHVLTVYTTWYRTQRLAVVVAGVVGLVLNVWFLTWLALPAVSACWACAQAAGWVVSAHMTR